MRKLLIVDDEILVRAAFRSLINWEASGYMVVGEAANGREALEKIALHRPDLVFTDLMMDPIDGFELMQHCATQFPAVRFIVLSSYNDFENVRKAMRLGALDYLFKLDAKPDQLRNMLSEIQWDDPPISSGHTDERAMGASLISHAIVADVPEPQLAEGFKALFPAVQWHAPFALRLIALV